MKRRDMRKAAGFTLVEAIIVMTVLGIISAIVATFMARPIQGYLDAARRAGMTDVADTALRRMAYEIRSAVPNSIRIAGSNRFVELIPATDGGRYRTQRDGAGCSVATPADPILNADDCTAADNDRFDVLGPAMNASAGDFVVIYNTGQSGLDAYQSGQNRRTITSAGSKLAFTATAAIFPPFESPLQRFQIVPASGPLSFGCVTVVAPAGYGTLELRRFTSYRGATDDWSAQPTAVAGSSSVLASDLSACSFDYQTVSAENGLLVLRLTVLRAGESVTLVHQVHVDNSP
jgi:MSHA biogenesis protein MshO